MSGKGASPKRAKHANPVPCAGRAAGGPAHLVAWYPLLKAAASAAYAVDASSTRPSTADCSPKCAAGGGLRAQATISNRAELGTGGGSRVLQALYSGPQYPTSIMRCFVPSLLACQQ